MVGNLKDIENDDPAKRASDMLSTLETSFDMLARQHRLIYNAYLKHGFNPQDALYLVGIFLGSSLQVKK